MKPKIPVTPCSVTTGRHPSLAKLKDAGYEVIFPTADKQPTEDDLHRMGGYPQPM
ncbi:MAG: hypothetical protein ABSC21_23475 [Terriglobia bacterium]